jgi:hypothetical protein
MMSIAKVWRIHLNATLNTDVFGNFRYLWFKVSTDHEEPFVGVDASDEDGHVLGAARLDAGDDHDAVVLVVLRLRKGNTR